jgi:hypothetical protein
MHAYQCVHLLSRELSASANRCGTAYMAVIRDAYGHAGNATQQAPDFDAASRSAGRFASDVNVILLDVPPWWQFWSRQGKLVKAVAADHVSFRRNPKLPPFGPFWTRFGEYT